MTGVRVIVESSTVPRDLIPFVRPTHCISCFSAPLRAGLFSIVLTAVRAVRLRRLADSGHKVAAFALSCRDLRKNLLRVMCCGS